MYYYLLLFIKNTYCSKFQEAVYEARIREVGTEKWYLDAIDHTRQIYYQYRHYDQFVTIKNARYSARDTYRTCDVSKRDGYETREFYEQHIIRRQGKTR
ncbi:hypothetical protein RCL1_003034 [Eukaryota sp. TZLM3-RCL]